MASVCILCSTRPSSHTEKSPNIAVSCSMSVNTRNVLKEIFNVTIDIEQSKLE